MTSNDALANIDAVLMEVPEAARPAEYVTPEGDVVTEEAVTAVALNVAPVVITYDPVMGAMNAETGEPIAPQAEEAEPEQDGAGQDDDEAALRQAIIDDAMNSPEGQQGTYGWEREMEQRRRELAAKEQVHEMFNAIRGVLKHVKFPAAMEDAYRGTLALWAIHTWTHKYQDSTPYILVTSPAAESGKSTALEVLATLAYAPVMEVGMTASNLVDYANDGRTVMIDEADELGKDKQFKAAINSGYKQSGFITRKRGKEQVRYSTYSPKVIAGIAREKMPVEGATLTRCINIKLQRALPGEVKKFRPRHPETKATLAEITDWLRTWADMNGAVIADSYPEVPASIGNRAAELWEPLLGVAEALGDEIAAEARGWAEQIQGQADKQVDPNVAFLSDLRAVLNAWIPSRPVIKEGSTARATRIKVADLHQAWLTMPERSFAEGLDLNRFSRRVASFGITSSPDKGARWYTVVDANGEFAPTWADTFARYAPSAD